MEFSIESKVLLGLNVAVGLASIYVAPQPAIISLLAGMALGHHSGSQIVSEAFYTHSVSGNREENIRKLLNSTPKFGTLLLGVTTLFASINRIGSRQIFGREQNIMNWNLMLLGFFLGQSLNIPKLQTQVDAAVANNTNPHDKSRLEGYLKAVI